ncbi:MAG: reverse transcriptase domain-containing protein [Methylococcales bacterium]
MNCCNWRGSEKVCAIYEQDFLSSSYGYRPGTGAHKAIKDLSAILRSGRYAWVVWADIKGFFDSIDHDQLLNRH